jgi:hypothetical protein
MSTGLAAERSCIFISYRRDDARGASGRVWDWLRIGFGREQVFRDVASIGAGKWRQKIEQALAASTACVAVIGRRWADATNLQRLQDSNDMVRHELETALASGDLRRVPFGASCRLPIGCIGRQRHPPQSGYRTRTYGDFQERCHSLAAFQAA